VLPLAHVAPKQQQRHFEAEAQHPRERGMYLEKTKELSLRQRNHHGLRYYWRKEGYKYEVYFLQEVVWLPWRYCSSLICFCLSLLLMPTTNSTDFEDFAWHVSQAHGIPAQVAKCIMNKLVVSFSSLLLPPFFGLANFCWGAADNCCCFFFTSLKLSKGRGKIEDSENAVGIHKFLDTHYECIPQVVWDAQDVSDCE